MASMNTEMTNMSNSLGIIKSSQEEEMRQKRIERAMSLTYVTSLSYFTDKNEYDGIWVSAELAKEVLGSFLLGCYGCNIPTDATLSSFYNKNDGETKAAKKAFREKFKKQNQDLTKREPRLVENTDGTLAIFDKWRI